MMAGANLMEYTKVMQNTPALRKPLYDWLGIEGSNYYYFSEEIGRFRGSDSLITDEKILQSARIKSA